VNKLKDIKLILANTARIDELPAQQQQKVNDESSNKKEKEEGDEVNNKEKLETATTKKGGTSDEIWTVLELEKVLIFISKVFLLNFPLYIAHKHGVHYGHESTQQEIQSVSMFCDIHDTEIPVYLYHNVTLFCSAGGFGAMTQCFEISDLPLSLAHACTVAISNIKLWLNYRSIVQLFVPLRIKVLQYMCKLSDRDLRSQATKSMAGMY
jgi:ubiquitin carboxyl-terminal hydrolase 34